MKFFFGFLAFIAAIVVIVLLAVGLVRTWGDSGPATNVSTAIDLLGDNTENSVARFTVEGPVVADENHKAIRITVSKNSRTVDVLSGYNGRVEKTSTIANTPEAYKAFLGALAAARFANKTATENGSPRDTCVTGAQYFFELQLDSNKPVNTWTSSCSLKHGNFAGDATATAQLFRSQIPNYGELTADVNVSPL